MSMPKTPLQMLAVRRRLPESTYRFQFHAGFTFRDAAAVAPYLRELGITHVYASPYLKARAGSTHGYDIIDHCQLNPELGTEADFQAFVSALTENDLSQILDIVPNHVGVATNDNVWWNDVLENGPRSKYGRYFDIAWEGSPRPQLHGKVLIPTLGESYGSVLERGQLQLSRNAKSGAIALNYSDRRFPINTESFFRAAALPPDAPADQIDAALKKMNGTVGEARSFDALDRLLEAQSYRLAYWRVASDEINYRRFFDINDLAALSMERQEVFDSTHKLIFRLLDDGIVTGLRIDHPDGLYDPKQYFDRLKERAESVSPADAPLYVVAEKILAVGEPLPPDWAVHGTSGYDFLNYVNGLFVDSAGEEPLSRFYADKIAPGAPAFADLVYQKKRLILGISLASELNMLARQLDRLAQQNRMWRDFTLNVLREGLRAVVACFGVYRTYISDAGVVTETDQKEIVSAVQRAIDRNPKKDPSVFYFIQDALLLKYPATFDDHARAAQRRFAGKFQQLTAPVTAKGIEDTAFYIYNRLVSLNEVGGDPDHFGVTPAELHRWFAERAQKWPHAMSSLSTHDTKRSEDVRARINVLSEIPKEWTSHVEKWMTVNAPHRQAFAAGLVAPSLNDEYLFYQTVMGAWPSDCELVATGLDEFVKRIAAYMIKAMREAKVNTSWTSPNEAYEKGVTTFIGRVLVDRRFLDDFLPLYQKVSGWGEVNALSQTLLRIAAPGVPDTYQGSELWDLSLVDPDNRRPVDYERRKKLMGRIGEQDPLPEGRADPMTKLIVTSRALRARREAPGLFSKGDYIPVEVAGSRAANVFSFARRHVDQLAIVAVVRLPASLGDASNVLRGWEATHLSLPPAAVGRKFRSVFTRESIVATEVLSANILFSRLPIALLISDR